jgi:crotonobetainyl-CoA:carnitine CoA-transferase CaiB-like acyl-CoA transferase
MKNSQPDDPRFATNAARLENHGPMYDQLQARIGERDRADLFAALTAAGVPAGPINTVAEAFEDPQFKARGMQTDHDGELGLRTPIVFSEADLTLEKGVPSLGETDLAAAKWSMR